MRKETKKRIELVAFMVAAFAAISISGWTWADTFTFVSPQKPGQGTSVWADIVVKEMQKHMPDHKLRVKHLPGARDIPAFNEFEKELQYDDNVVMISHGGNGVSFLQESVDYNYANYDSIGLMNLNIIVGKKLDADLDNIKFKAKSGRVPDALAMTMMVCGPMTYEEYKRCFDQKITWVKGMSGGEARLAFKRGELNVTRENPAAYKKHVKGDSSAEVWFHHGILQLDGSHNDDPNYRGFQFEDLYKQRWGVSPSGNMYEAYKLVKSFRDGLQKALWVRKGNPNTEALRAALRKVASSSESVAAIQKKVGKYDWVIGDDANQMRDVLMTFITKDALKTLVDFSSTSLSIPAIYKPQLVK